MYLQNCVIVGVVMCCVFAGSTSAGPKDLSNKNPVRSAVSPSPENDKKAEELLRTTLKAKQKPVLALLDQYKAERGTPWRYDKGIREGYVKLEKESITIGELAGLSNSILNTIIELPYSYRRPVKDKELLRAVLGMCYHTKLVISNSFLSDLVAFSDVPEESIEGLMPVLMRNPKARPLLHIPLSEAMKKKYRTVFNGLIASEKQRYKQYIKDGKETVASQIVHLRHCARMGDDVSLQKLIVLFGQLKWDGKDYGSNAGLAIKMLFDIGTRDCIIAVLKRFRENAGSPKYLAGASPRALVLRLLLWKYPEDRFFEPYRDYLASPYHYTILDSSIGGEAGVKKLYLGLQVWVKKRYDYKLNLDGAEPKIRITPLSTIYSTKQ